MAKMTPVQQTQFLLNRAIIVFDSNEDLIKNSKKIDFKLNDVVLVKESGVEYRKLEETNKNGIPYAIDNSEPSTTYYWNLYKFNTGFSIPNELELRKVTGRVVGDVVFVLGKNTPGDGKHTLRVKSTTSSGLDSIPSDDGGFWNVVPLGAGGSGGGGDSGGEGTDSILSLEETQALIDKYKNLGKQGG